MSVTVIFGADVAVAWDEAAGRHVYRQGADVAFDGGTITYVGPHYDGPADDCVDGRGHMVMPGLVNIHAHPSSEAMNKGVLDEIGSPALYNSSLYEYMPLLRPDAEAIPDCVQVAYSELMLSGVTTVADMSVPHPGWLDLAARSGLRVCLSPMFRSAHWFTRNGHVVEYEWDAAAGERAMAEAFAVIEAAQTHPSGRLFGMVSPSQIDTCTPDLIRDSRAEARRRGLPWQIHAAQSTVEFHEITRRHGVSPIQWLESLGVLDEASIIGHCIFLDDYPRNAWHSARDLDILARNGVSVAHCPTVFMRRGIAMQDFGRYRRAGVTMALGTDTYPHNMLEEMRAAAYAARLMAQNPRTMNSGDLFEAATTAGARALGRSDIGRLAPGCKADIVMVDLDHPMMQPRRDPVRSLIYAAAERAVRRVFVDGRVVVEGGEVVAFDYAAAARRLNDGQQRAIAAAPGKDWAGRAVDDYAPLTFPSA